MTKYKLEDFKKWLEEDKSNRSGMEEYWEYFLNWYEERPNAWDETIEVGWNRQLTEECLEDWKSRIGKSAKQEVEVLYQTIFIWKYQANKLKPQLEKKLTIKDTTLMRDCEIIIDAITLQEYLNKRYPTKEEREKVREIRAEKIDRKRKDQGITEKLDGGELDLSEYSNLEVVYVVGNDLKSPLTKLTLGELPNLRQLWCSDNQLTSLDVSGCSSLRKFWCYENKITELTLGEKPNLKELKCLNNQLNSLDISQCPKLTDLYINADLFTENKIIGLEKTSLFHLDYQERSLLQKSDDPKFIWEILLRKYQTIFPEMALIEMEDLNNLASQLNQETFKDETFLKQLKQFCHEKIVRRKKDKFYWVLDCLDNQVLARCLIIQNRLDQGKDEKYEKRLIEMAQEAECQRMNPKRPQNFLYEDRKERIKKVREGDKELLERLQDLSYLKAEHRREENKQLEEVDEQNVSQKVKFLIQKWNKLK